MCSNDRGLFLAYSMMITMIVIIIGAVFSVNGRLVGSFTAPKIYVVLIGTCLAAILYLLTKIHSNHLDATEFTSIELLLILNLIITASTNFGNCFSHLRLDH